MKNIYTNTPVRQHISAYQPTSSNDSCTDAADRALQVEKEAHTKQSQERIVTFENILCNNSLDCETWKPVMTGMFGIFGAILSTAIYTLIPVHNVIENPQYWYEGIFQAVFVFYPICNFRDPQSAYPELPIVDPSRWPNRKVPSGIAKLS